MFLRPRRFGKTMFTELLRYYCDIALKEEADGLYRVAGGFTQTDVSREGENQIALTVYTAISAAAGSGFDLTKEYAIKRNGKFVFADGLEENE